MLTASVALYSQITYRLLREISDKMLLLLGRAGRGKNDSKDCFGIVKNRNNFEVINFVKIARTGHFSGR